MHTHPKVAAVASQNWPFRHDAKCEPLLKFLKANIHEASSHAYPLNLPTRVREDPLKIALLCSTGTPQTNLATASHAFACSGVSVTGALFSAA
jgi:hypothetical protein